MEIAPITELVSHIKDLRMEFDETAKTLSFIRNDPNSGEEALVLLLDYPLIYDSKYLGSWKDCLLFLLTKQDLLEREIKQVKIEGQYLGWLIPVDALNSAEHQYGDAATPEAINFVRFCLIANQVLGFFSVIRNRQIFKFPKRTILSELFKKNSAVLLLNKNRLPKNFDIYSIIPTLALQGFFFSPLE